MLLGLIYFDFGSVEVTFREMKIIPPGIFLLDVFS